MVARTVNPRLAKARGPKVTKATLKHHKRQILRRLGTDLR